MTTYVNMTNTAFSIVIPLYNKEKHISRTLTSIVSQTYTNYEVLVVDDGSTDQSVRKVQEVSIDNLRIISQANSGVSVARNTGIKTARYKWIVFLDADDELHPEYLQSIQEMIKKFPNEKVFGTGYNLQYVDGSQTSPTFYGVPEQGTFDILPNYFESMIKGNSLIAGSIVCIHKDVFNTTGLFPVGFKLGEDLDMWFRIMLYFKMVYYNKPLFIYNKDVSGAATAQMDDVRNTFPYYKWFKAPRNKFNLPYQKRYIFIRLAKSIYLMAQHRKLHQVFRFFFR